MYSGHHYAWTKAMKNSCEQQSSLLLFSRGSAGIAEADSSVCMVLSLAQSLDLGHRDGQPVFGSQAHIREREQSGKSK